MYPWEYQFCPKKKKKTLIFVNVSLRVWSVIFPKMLQNEASPCSLHPRPSLTKSQDWGLKGRNSKLQRDLPRMVSEATKGAFIRSFTSLIAQLVKNPPTICRRPQYDSWVRKIHCRRERLPTPVCWPGEFHGLYSPWRRKESDTTEWLSLHVPSLDQCAFAPERDTPNPCSNCPDSKLFPGQFCPWVSYERGKSFAQEMISKLRNG